MFNTVVGNLEAPPQAFAELAENLAKLERYERRAFSRRKRALHLLANSRASRRDENVALKNVYLY
jgi:hypothetical protein